MPIGGAVPVPIDIQQVTATPAKAEKLAPEWVLA